MTHKFIHTAPYGVQTIRRIIPHRHPFLLPDGITAMGEDNVDGFKNISISDPVFQGHFPEEPVYPGVLQIELIAQVGACWILSLEQNVGKTAYLMTVESAKFRRPIRPGDRADVFGTITNLKSRTGRLAATIKVGEQVASEATILFAFQKAAG